MLLYKIESFCASREGEFNIISEERKADLLLLSDYILAKLERGEMPKITVICTHNSRRSHLTQLWLAVAADYYNLPAMKTFSGGTEATAFNIRAVNTMRKIGFEIDVDKASTLNPDYRIKWSKEMTPYHAFSKKYEHSANPSKDFAAIMVCNSADKNCPMVVGSDFRLSLPFEDPKDFDDTDLEAEKYRERAEQICREMLFVMKNCTTDNKSKEKHQEVKEYYGETLQSGEDLKTNACCTIVAPPQYISEVMGEIADEVMAKYYGCGLTIPYELEGLRVLDLGSGSGRDCYIASKLVGQTGEVIGVDMTDEQLEVANKYIDYHTAKFGFKHSNVKFVKGNIDNLEKLDLAEASFDLIISNCVINLAMDKEKVLADAYRLLKPGGEMYFSDVYSDRRVSKELQNDPVLWGECLSGALYWNDFLNISKKVGFTDPRAVESHPITVENRDLEEKLGDYKFYSVTYRLWKIDGLESDCEDYGQACRYLGTIKGRASSFDLDDHHNFQKGKMMTVCGNTYKMLHDTRLAKHFEFFGTWDTHYGIFEGCGGNMPFGENVADCADGSCC